MELSNAITNAVRRLEAQGLDAFEVAGLAESSLVVEAKEQMVEGFRRSSSRGIAIRVMKDGRTGFAATTELAPRQVDLMVQQVLLAMREVAPSEEAAVPAAQEPVAGLAEELGRTFAEIPDDEKIRMALALESAAIAADSRIARVQHPRYEETTRLLTVVNSKGVRAEARRSLCLCELKAVAADGDETQGAYEFAFSPRFEDLDVEATAKRSARRAVEKLGGKPIPACRCPVLFTPRAAAAMLKLAAPSFFADNVQRGKSVLAAKRGERAYRPEISIVDDGLLAGGLGSFPFDGEGIPRRRTVMVRNGVVENWLYDGACAAKEGVLSTGNCAREGLRRLPAIGVGNCFLKAGTKSPLELVRETGRGLLVTDLAGLHMANTISGDFSLGAEGAQIEGGAVGAPVRGVTIAGNVHEFFAAVAGVGNDLLFLAEYGAPSLLVEELSVGA